MAGGHKKLAKGHKKLEKKGGTRNWPKRAQETGGSSPDSGEGHKKLGAQVLILAKGTSIGRNEVLANRLLFRISVRNLQDI